MTKEFILQKLSERYIEPTKRKRGNYIGVEIEMPIVNLGGKPVDFSVVHSLTAAFIAEFSFNPTGTDDGGNIYAAQNADNRDILSYDCSYNNLELSFGKEQNLCDVYDRFRKYYSFIQDYFEKYNYTLTGMGVNPHWNINRNVPIENGRYRMLFHHLHTYTRYDLPMYFHNHPDYGTFSSAAQVQLDVSYDKLPLTINTFSKLEPIKALLFNNSVLLGENEQLHCCRDMFWENSTHGINPHNIGMFDCEISSADDLLSYIASTSIYCVERGEKYINFQPINIVDYLQSETVKGEYFDGEAYREIDVKPTITDIDHLRTFKFEDVTFRGTVEFRSVCCQPVFDSLCAAAFHIGLMPRVEELAGILKNDTVIYHNGYTAGELRKLFVKSELPGFINADNLYALAKRIVDISYEELKSRGKGEERFLLPLYDRIENRTNPAKTMLLRLSNGEALNTIIKEYGKLN